MDSLLTCVVSGDRDLRSYIRRVLVPVKRHIDIRVCRLTET